MTYLIKGWKLFQKYFDTTKTSPITDYPETDFVISANEQVRCKYSDQIVSYDLMESKFPGYDNRNFGLVLLTNDTYNPDLHDLNDSTSFIYYANCEDRAGNLANLVNVTFNISLDPDLKLENGKPYGIVPNNSVLMQVQTNHKAICTYKEGAGIENQFSSTNARYHSQLLTSIPDGSHSYTITCKYFAGTTLYQKTGTITFTIDTTPPSAPTISSSHSQNTWSSNNTVSFTWVPGLDYSTIFNYEYILSNDTNCNGNNGNYILTANSNVTLFGMQDGSQFFCVRVVDEFGRKGTFGSRVFKIDTKAPISNSIDTLNGNWHNYNFVQQIIANDALSQVGSIYYSLNNGPTTIVSGSQAFVNINTNNYTNLTYFAVDLAGNIENPNKTISLKLDKELSTLIYLNSSTHSLNATSSYTFLQMQWDGSDLYSGIEKYEFELYKDGMIINNGYTSDKSKTFHLSNGNIKYTFRIRPIDFAGNIGAWSFDYNVYIDTIGPTSIYADELPLYTANTTVNIAGVVYSASQIFARNIVGNITNGPYNGILYYTSNLPLQTALQNDYYANDNKIIVLGDLRDTKYQYLELISQRGEYKILSKTYTSSPSMTQLTLQPSLRAGATKDTTVNVYENSRINGAFDINNIPLNSGVNNIILKAVDIAGNYIEKYMRQIILDTFQPVIYLDSTYSTISDGDIRNGQGIRVKFDYNDMGLSGIDLSSIQLFYNNTLVLPDSISSTSLTYSVLDTLEGDHSIEIKLKDKLSRGKYHHKVFKD